jgi:FKBP-type peptidyl-prolyl cis-trans isomerase FkpA
MSVTTVPIPPAKKSTLIKYWVGIALLLAVGAALAFVGTDAVRTKYQGNDEFFANNKAKKGVVTTATGLQYQVLTAGKGASPTEDDVALVSYKGTFRDGKVFDENPQAAMPVAGVVPGFSEALKKMQRGGKYRIWIPSDLGYGPEEKKNPQTGEVMMPANSMLIFEVELLEFKSRAEVEAMQKEIEKMQKKQGAGGPPQGMPQGMPQGAPQGLPPEIQAQLDAQAAQQGQMPR